MSQQKKHIMTYEGVKKLEEELVFLKTVKRKEITEKIKVALGFGDLLFELLYDLLFSLYGFLSQMFHLPCRYRKSV